MAKQQGDMHKGRWHGTVKGTDILHTIYRRDRVLCARPNCR